MEKNVKYDEMQLLTRLVLSYLKFLVEVDLIGYNKNIKQNDSVECSQGATILNCNLLNCHILNFNDEKGLNICEYYIPIDYDYCA